MEIEPDRKDLYGKVYYLKSVEIDINIFSHADASSVYRQVYSDTLQFTQMVYQTYGLFSVFVDFSLIPFSEWDKNLKSIFLAKAEVSYYKSVLDYFKENKSSVNIKKHWKKFGFENEFNLGITKTKLGPGQAEQLIARQIFLFLSRNRSEESIEKLIDLSHQLLATLKSRLHSIAVTNKVRKLRSQRDDWWENWSATPGLRWAIFGSHAYQNSNDESNLLSFKLKNSIRYSDADPLIWRQTNLITNFGNEPIKLGDSNVTPQLTDFVEITKRAGF